MNITELPFVLAGASGVADPFITALTIFLMSALIGVRLFSETTSHSATAKLGLLVGICGVATLGAIVIAAGSGEMFSRVAGVLAVALASAAAVGGFLLTRTLLKEQVSERRDVV